MPKDVPLTAEGFEDPNAFFNTPGNNTTMTFNRSIRTPGGVASTTVTTSTGKTAKSGYNAGIGIGIGIGSGLGSVGGTRTGTVQKALGRMSALAGDDSGDEFEEDLLVDDDELNAGEWFRSDAVVEVQIG